MLSVEEINHLSLYQTTNQEDNWKLNHSLINYFKKEFENNTDRVFARNVVSENGFAKSALDRDRIQKINHLYRHMVTQEGKPTHQKQSGRCWLFAGLNVMRMAVKKEYNLENFEFSQSYLFFWDKLEKSNYFLNSIIETRNEPLNSRLVQWLLQELICDGGQWDMFINLVNKYGVVPKNIMDETFSSSNSRTLNLNLKSKLREFACQLRNMENRSKEDLLKEKSHMLQEVYNIMVIHLGTPPKIFDWVFKNKNKQVNLIKDLSPIEFLNKFVRYKPSDKVCLINAPTNDKPYSHHFTVKYLGNIWGGKKVSYINLPSDDLKSYAKQMIDRDEPVWFGCDVGKELVRDLGLMDPKIYQYEQVYGTKPNMTKAERLEYGHSLMTHAMVLTGYDDKKWRIENSWGEKHGDKGFLQMTDKWFDEYVYEVAIDKSLLSKEHCSILKMDPIELEPWDPMGSLA